MKRNKTIVFAFLLCLGNQLSAQRVVEGADANEIVKGAELIRFEEESSEISYLRLSSATNISYEAHLEWMLKVLRAGTDDAFKLYHYEDDELGFSHYRYQQTYKGIDVHYGLYYAHFKDGKLHSINGKFYRIDHLEVDASLSRDEAFGKALAASGATQYIWNAQDPMDFAKGDMRVLALDKSTRLCYRFDIYSLEPLDRSDYFVDAHSGQMVQKIRTIAYANAEGTAYTKYSGVQKIVTDSVSPTLFRLRQTGRGGGIETYNMQKQMNYSNAVDFTSTNNVWTDTTNQNDVATDIHYNSEVVYDYFYNVHSRNSYDGFGGRITNYVHWDRWLDMAFWDGLGFSYGDGDGINTKAYGSLDIVAHEFTHALNDFTASLTYLYESGALLESFCDILAVGADFYKNPSTANYMIGEKITFNQQPLRNLASPKIKLQPDTYLGQYWTTQLGMEHINSGVQNKWFFVLAEGDIGINDKGDTFNVLGIGVEKAVKIAYRTLTNYLHPTANYNDARFYSIQAALDLYGNCRQEVFSTTNAWYAVGIGHKYQADSIHANFTSNLQFFCKTPAQVVFQNRSSNASNYLWSFGDGNFSNAVNPSHIYQNAGKYTVSLSVWDTTPGCNLNDTDTYVVLDYIYIKANPVLGFKADITSAIAGIDVVTLTDTADNCILSWKWEISPKNYVLISPSHDYPEIKVAFIATGNYTVKLIYGFGLSSDSVVKNNYIQVTTPPAPDFEADNDRPRRNIDTVLIKDSREAYWRRNWTITPAAYSVIQRAADNSWIKVVFHNTGCYDVRLDAILGTDTQRVSKSCFINCINYCTPSVSTLNQDVGISLFQLGDIYNISSIGMAAYTDYTSQYYTDLSLYDTFDFTLARNSAFNDMNRKVWIDWNIDGDFTDAGELVAHETSSSKLVYQGKIIVPGNARIGYTTLRIGTSLLNMSNEPCGPNSFGEFEDYRVRVVKSIPLIAMLKNDQHLQIEQCTQNYTDSGFVISRQYNPINRVDTFTNLNTAVAGSYYYRYEITDSSGYKVSLERKINVIPIKDLRKEFVLNGNIIDTADVHDTYVDPGYSYNINCNVIDKINVISFVNASNLGEYSVFYILEGYEGQLDTAVRIVRVVDRTPPVISLNGYSVIFIGVHTAFVDPGVTISDNYDTNIKAVVTGKVYSSWVGTYELIYSATDSSGNGPVSVSRTVKVVDTIAPVITSAVLKNGDTILIDVFDTYYDPLLNATDNYSINLHKTKSGNFFTTFPDNKANIIGLYTASYIYTDSSGNSASFDLLINVVDREKPLITLHGITMINLESPKTFDNDSFSVSDNYDTDVAVVRSGDYFTKYLVDFKLGFYTIYYDATDQSGNQATTRTRYINVEKYSNVKALSRDERFKLYPNPTSAVFYITVNEDLKDALQVDVFNNLGQLVKATVFSNVEANSPLQMDLSGMEQGVYIVRLNNGSSTIRCMIHKIE